ncbi:serine protease [Alginatibacterium sediminis]|uniref:Serine protease n=1 Tax=Alginatibacterium sediminis TaxID=2164068 RepID=A0A420E748_9ALTE|nr:serine protease [Alginatibacterium sediminis]RKF14372.1 serine protease [Alginatibacterium sediminis]
MKVLKFILIFICCVSRLAFAANLPDTIETIKPSIVGIGKYNKLSSPRATLSGTGFVVGNGTFVATNAHVVDGLKSDNPKDQLVVFIGQGRKPIIRDAKVAAIDRIHDLAILKISGSPQPAMVVDSTSRVRDGEDIAFTGFPIGAVLGLYPVTHKGIVSAITPVVTPARRSSELTIAQIKRAKNPFTIYQLDATAYPGNSGSPVYWPSNGKVIAIINKVFVKSSKESVLKDPSAITYAIPSKHLSKLLQGIK